MSQENFFSLEQIIDRHPLTVAPETSVLEVIKLMQEWGNSCPISNNENNSETSSTPTLTNSCAIVIIDFQVQGIFTERDLVKIIAAELDFDCTPINEVMSRELITLIPTGLEDVLTALKLLGAHSIRHLPVVDKHNRLLGLISETSLRENLQPINLMRWRRMEALVRWQHPTLGLVTPADFISIAEETGIIIALDQWVLKNASSQFCEWKNQFPAFAHLTLNVNLSGKHFFQSNLTQKIDTILAETGLESQSLKLEITESVMIQNSESVLETLTQLINKKIQICLDDFGTGYSSLSYLHRFPIDVLKIDRSFIHNLNLNNSQSAIVRTIIVMARELGIKAIAEGVETLEQLNFLKALGCSGAQGYGFSPPLNSQAMTSLLTQVTEHQNQEVLFGNFAKI
ncbi:MAG: EAL domain-containing protein [Xenococcaceae cyanobacterium MO_167.B27]|nr:EAL domain-containing protein [Xenococcaceae cyanobacterium MO_167.B27]